MRKYFKTKCELAGLRPIHIEMLLGHDLGLDASYHNPTEKELLEDYLKAVELLTFEDANKNVDKITSEVTRKVTADLNEQLNNVTNELALTNFQNIIDRTVEAQDASY